MLQEIMVLGLDIAVRLPTLVLVLMKVLRGTSLATLVHHRVHQHLELHHQDLENVEFNLAHRYFADASADHCLGSHL